MSYEIRYPLFSAGLIEQGELAYTPQFKSPIGDDGMSIHCYSQFAREYASLVGGQALSDALSRQIAGDDRDVYELSWSVASVDEAVRVAANIKADFDRRLIDFSIDEALDGASGYVSVLSLVLNMVEDDPQLLRADEVIATGWGQVVPELRRFAALAPFVEE